MPQWLKWIIAGLAPAFAAGSLALGAGRVPDFAFWWGVGGAFVGGLAGIAINKVGDNMTRPDEGE